MNNITQETRRESWGKTQPHIRPRAQEILRALGAREMTAREVMEAMGYTDPNMVRPRLTELVGREVVKVSGRRYDPATERTVAVYKAVG